MIVDDIKIEKAGMTSPRYGAQKEEYYKMMIHVFDKWWEWKPKDITKRMDLQKAIKYRDELRSAMGH